MTQVRSRSTNCGAARVGEDDGDRGGEHRQLQVPSMKFSTKPRTSNAFAAAGWSNTLHRRMQSRRGDDGVIVVLSL